MTRVASAAEASRVIFNRVKQNNGASFITFFSPSEIRRCIKTKMKVVVVPYDSNWPHEFKKLREILEGALSKDANAQRDVHTPAKSFRIEHVGSTSVPGLAAKPIIDIDIVIPTRYELREVIAALAKLDYEHRGNLGVQDREAFRKPANIETRHNLYVCPAESLALKNHLVLRDSLRSDNKLRDEYAALKQELARKYPESIDDYVDGKTEFILGILAKHGLGSELLEEIRGVNQKI